MAGAVLLDVIGCGHPLARLDAQPRARLDRTGAAITPRRRLSFTSGINPDPPCARQAAITLTCTATIGSSTTVARLAPASTSAGLTSQQPAARPRSPRHTWNHLFEDTLAAPLGLPGRHLLPRRAGR